MLKAGDLDRQVKILAETEVKDSDGYGTDVTTGWAVVATVSAQVQDVLPSRAGRMAEGINIERRPARVRIRYRTDVTMKNRLEFEGRQMRIVAGPSEIGRREGIELIVEQLSTEGDPN